MGKELMIYTITELKQILPKYQPSVKWIHTEILAFFIKVRSHPQSLIR